MKVLDLKIWPLKKIFQIFWGHGGVSVASLDLKKSMPLGRETQKNGANLQRWRNFSGCMLGLTGIGQQRENWGLIFISCLSTLGELLMG